MTVLNYQPSKPSATLQPGPDRRSERPGAGQTHVLREGVSVAGRRVVLTLDQGTYQGAKPYHTVAYLKQSGGPQMLRYTPFRDRAEFLYGRFLTDITDPSGLGERAQP